MRDRVAEVLAGYDRGWSFTPLQRSGKKPLLKDWTNRPRPTRAQVEKWARRGNIGLRTGPDSGVYVVDEDTIKGGKLQEEPLTVTVETGSGGRHYYFEAPKPCPGNTASKIGEHVDTRGVGGQVVYPGSIHPDTKRPYRWAPGRSPDEIALAPLPAWIAERVTKPQRESRPASAGTVNGDCSAYARKAVEGETRKVREASEGQRNHQLNASAFNLGQLVGSGILARHEAEAALAVAAALVGLEEGEILKTLKSGLDAGEREPRRPEPKTNTRTNGQTSQPSSTNGGSLSADSATNGHDVEPDWIRNEALAAEEAPASSHVRVWHREDLLALLLEDQPPIDWRIKGLAAAAECQSFTAPPKHAKTWTWLSIACSAAVGRPALGQYEVPRPLRITWVDEEMGRAKLRRRLQRLVAGMALTDDELALLGDGLALYPQQGFTLDPCGSGLDALRKAIESHRADILVVDSFTALQLGEENSNSERRAFYSRAIAPLKTEFNLSVVLLAHPPLPPSDGKGEAPKRPRGAGDSLAFVDRAWWQQVTDRADNEHGKTLKISLEETLSREGQGLSPQLLILEDVSAIATVCRAEGDISTETVGKVGKVGAATWQIIAAIQDAGGRAYQPEVKKVCAKAGASHDVYNAALRSLEILGRIKVEPPEPGSRKSGKWLRLVEVPDDAS